MYKYERGEVPVGVILAVAALLLVAYWVASIVQGVADVINTDMRTAFWECVLFSLLVGWMIWSASQGFLAKMLCYAPALAVLCLIPALTFWSWGYSIPPHQDGILGLLSSLRSSDELIASRIEPLWFGSTFAQLGMAALVGIAGFFANKWIES
jgi:hypothetical protein